MARSWQIHGATMKPPAPINTPYHGRTGATMPWRYHGRTIEDWSHHGEHRGVAMAPPWSRHKVVMESHGELVEPPWSNDATVDPS